MFVKVNSLYIIKGSSLILSAYSAPGGDGLS